MCVGSNQSALWLRQRTRIRASCCVASGKKSRGTETLSGRLLVMFAVISTVRDVGCENRSNQTSPSLGRFACCGLFGASFSAAIGVFVDLSVQRVLSPSGLVE